MMQLEAAEREQKWAELCLEVERLIKEHGVPGVALGLLIDGQIYQQGFGATSLTNPLPVTPETLFQIGSVTKTVTGTAVMRLVEQGLIDLDATVRTYLPTFRVADEATSAQVTVRHLLTHTAGWVGDFYEATGAGDDALAKFVDLMANLPQQTPVGELFAYNNAALCVGGRIIEVVTGKSYEAAVKELLLEPLGLSASFFFPGEVMTRRFAVGHVLKDGASVVAEPWNLERNLHPAGGLCCPIGDLLRWARFHMGDGRSERGEVILSPEALRLMQTPAGTHAPGGITWGLGTLGGVRIVAHTGGTYGQNSILTLAPEQGVALAIMTNHDSGEALINAVNGWVRREYLGIKPAPAPEPLVVTAEHLAACAGRYLGLDDRCILSVEGESLILRHEVELKPFMPEQDPLPPMRVALIEGERFLVQDGPVKGTRGEFLTTRDGRRWIRVMGRLYQRQA